MVLEKKKEMWRFCRGLLKTSEKSTVYVAKLSEIQRPARDFKWYGITLHIRA
jgi:hypothetical protein